MTPELLELIKWFHDTCPEAWPEWCGADFDGSNLILPGLGHPDSTRAFLSIVESAVMDCAMRKAVRVVVYPLQVIIVAGEDVTGESGVMLTCRGQHKHRIHTLLLAVKAMHERGRGEK